ncbi:Mis12-domain-containing protein [Pisolithus marmoratus]|nr:Mis12-domain-containing protein [Pisolithus marmoratus]
MSAQGPTVPPVLLPEILEFSPQLLLDDIINFANEAITNAVDGLEEFLFRWAADRETRVHDDWDSTQEVEQGLVAFQTLLEYHTDIAFDFFETWSLRNIFAIPADLPIVVPHQEGLDLDYPAELETDLMAEVQSLRKKIDAQRRLKRLLARSARLSSAKARRSEKKLSELSFLGDPLLHELGQIPDRFESMFTAASSLPPLTPEATAALTQLPLPDPGKRPWELSKAGYIDWATKQLLTKVKHRSPDVGNSAIESTTALLDTIGTAQHLADIAKHESIKSSEDAQRHPTLS